MNNPNKYYVYAHQRLDDDSIFYIGKGTGKRAWSKKVRNKHWKNIVNKVGYRVLILQDGMSETDAFTLEKYLIVFYGRADLDEGRLANLTDGGEGSSGTIVSEATRKSLKDIAIRQHQSMSDIEKKARGENISKSKHSVSEEKKAERKENMSKGKLNMSPEQKQFVLEKYKKTLAAKTPEQKQRAIEKRKETMSKWSQEKMDAYNKKRVEALKQVLNKNKKNL